MPMNSMVRRVVSAVVTGLLISAGIFLYLYFSDSYDRIPDLYTLLGLFFWYPVLGFILGIAGPISHHPVFPSLRMKYIRGIVGGFGGNLLLTLLLHDLMQDHIAATLPAMLQFSPLILVPLEGAFVGFVLDSVGSSIGGEGKSLLDYEPSLD